VAQDRVWATFIQNGAIRVGRLQTSGTSWAFITLPGVTAPSPDDLSQIVAFRDRQGAKIGVMWSDQALGIQRFAWRFAGSTLPLSEGWTIETAYGSGVGCSGPLCADDHINMKATGRQLFGVVKTSMTDVPEPNPDDPLIVLLRRNAAGKWSSTTVSPVSQNASRPMLQLAPTLDRLYVFAQLDFSGTYYWQSSLSAPAFDSMATTPWTVDGTTSIGNPTGTKQPLSTATGLVVATSNNGADTYWHNQVSLP